MRPKKPTKASPKNRFAVGARVLITKPGIHGVVKQVDDEISVMGQYWHTVETTSGDSRQPGSILELVPNAITNEQPQRTHHNIHIHGDHSRINIHSTDNSTNYISNPNDEQLFLKLKTAASELTDAVTRNAILSHIDEMEAARKSGGFAEAYQKFVGVAADHLTLFLPLLPLLTQMLSGH